jgi:Protein of unknown function (DUF4232)
MNRRLIPTVAILALVLAGCGSSSSSSSTRASAATRAKTVTTTLSYTVTATKTGTAPQTTSPSAPCLASVLKLTWLGQQGGMGHGELGFSLQNISSKPCRTGGYPGLLFLDGAGRSLTTVPTRVTRDFFGTTPVVQITLSPGQSASFRLGTTHEAQGSATCTTAAAVQVIAPNDTATLRTKVPDGIYECQTVTVSPLRPGPTTYP